MNERYFPVQLELSYNTQVGDTTRTDYLTLPIDAKGSSKEDVEEKINSFINNGGTLMHMIFGGTPRLMQYHIDSFSVVVPEEVSKEQLSMIWDEVNNSGEMGMEFRAQLGVTL